MDLRGRKWQEAGYASHDIFRVHIKKYEMSGACKMQGRGAECIQNFGWKTQKKETTWKTWA
jgi:hypothetical protein